MSELPPGFVLDQPVDAGLPAGFVLDKLGAGEDLAKSAGSGLANATASTLGFVGDMRGILSEGGGALADKIGIPQSARDVAKTVAGYTPFGVINSAPTSKQILDSATDPIVDPNYKPQYATGGYAKTIAEFAPGALLGGPRGLLPKLATNVFAPAVASETAGLLTKDTAAEPYARAAGALVGGVWGTKLANTMTEARALKAATPALADVKNEATTAYDALTARNVALPLPQSTLNNLADDITTTLNNRGIRPSNAETIHKAVEEIRTPATAGAADVADLVAARQSIKESLGKPDSNKAGAFIALGKIENAIEANSPGTMAKIKEADKNYSAFKAAEALDKRTAKAELRAASTDSGMNAGQKIRQNVASLLSSAEAKYLSAGTKADLEKIVRGTATQQVIRKIDRLLGGGGGLGMMVGGIGTGYQADGWQGALLGGLTAHGLRSSYNRSVLKGAEKVGQNIRARSPLGQQAPILPQSSSEALAALRSALLARPK